MTRNSGDAKSIEPRQQHASGGFLSIQQHTMLNQSILAPQKSGYMDQINFEPMLRVLRLLMLTQMCMCQLNHSGNYRSSACSYLAVAVMVPPSQGCTISWF
jgi:hypothetical protein